MGKLELFTSVVLLTELQDVLEREKFARRLAIVGITSRDLVLGYAALAAPVAPLAIPAVILDDPEVDAVLSCALSAQAEVIVSGDSHLLSLKSYRGIDILTAPKLLAQLPKQ